MKFVVLRSNHRRCSIKKDVLKKFSKPAGKQLRWSLFIKKIASLRPETLFKIRLRHSCFPLHLAEFLRATFFIEHLRWLLLKQKTSTAYQTKKQKNTSRWNTSILRLRVLYCFH